VKASRFYSYYHKEAMPAFLLEWYVLLLVLCVYGIRKGLWKSVNELMDLRHAAGDFEVEETAKSNQTTKQCTTELKLRRGKCSNTLHFSALVLASPWICCRCVCLCNLVNPFRDDQGLWITCCKTRRGRKEYYISSASRRWVLVFVDVLNFFQDEDKLRWAGFSLPGDVNAPRLSTEDEMLSSRLLHSCMGDLST
jgi:hypothetical protein